MPMKTVHRLQKCHWFQIWEINGHNGQIWLPLTSSPFIPSQRMEEKGGGESWRVIPATTQDPTLPELGGTPYRIVLGCRGVRGLGALHLQGTWFDGTMFIVVGAALGRPCSALWTNWGGMWVKTAKKCYLSSWVPFLSLFSTEKKSLFGLLKHAN